MMKKYLLLTLTSCSFILAWAQHDVTLPSLRRTYQSTYMNPAFMPQYGTSVGIPILSNIYINNTLVGFNLKDVIDSKNADSTIDVNKFVSKISGDGIGFQTAINTDFFHVSFPVGSFQVSIHSGSRFQNSQLIGKDFIGFFANGNESFRGRTAVLEPLRINSVNYIENGISVAKQFGKLSVGVRGKFLLGTSVTRTENLSMSFFTPEDRFDPVRVSLNGKLQTSGIPLLFDSVTGETKNQSDKEFNTNNLYSFRNNGFGFDAGFTYKIFPSLQVHASVIDLGAITWRNNTFNYSFTGTEVSSSGITFDQLDNRTTGRYGDSLLNLLIDSKVTRESFKTTLQSRYLAGADWNFTKRDRLGFLFQGRNIGSSVTTSYTGSYTRKMSTNWDLTANYTVYSFINSTVGFGSSVKWGPVQWYIVTDDLLVLFRPSTSNMIYLRLGLNLVFTDKLKTVTQYQN